jgi:hypothetical protein
MPSDQLFPWELLKQPRSARLNYLCALTIGHPLLLRAYDDVCRAIQDSDPGSIILVQGPAGVGKTALLQRIERDFRERLMPGLIKDVERVPVARIEAIRPDSSAYNLGDYFTRLMIALGEPESLINRRIIQDQTDLEQCGDLQPTSRPNTFSSKLRQRVEQTLRRRRPLAVLVDDIQHLGSGHNLLEQINDIKSIASLT